MEKACAKVPDEEESSPKAKKLKTDDDADSPKASSVHESLTNLASFRVKRILNINNARKAAFMEGTFDGHESPAVVLLEKKAFSEDDLRNGFLSADAPLQKNCVNDVYGRYEYFPVAEYTGLSATIIHPASKKHIEKYEKKEMHLVEETPELYNQVTLPYLEKTQFSLEWVDNILKHKAETDRVLYEDPDVKTGFIMVPDLRWNGKSEELHVLALPFQRIRSIRDLNEQHLPLLRNIRKAGLAAILSKHKLLTSRIRMYFHYQPTYYHLHVHFTSLACEAEGIYTEKAHLLSTVINNIELVPDYYQKATLTFCVSRDEQLFKQFEKQGALNKTDVE